MIWPRAILHVDMDAFYASVEQRDAPSLRGRPVIVGGHPTRGVVLAASYEVRPFGVRSAMPMSRALRLAPNAVIVPPRFSAYAEASAEIFRIFSAFTPLVEPLSLDEAFLDVTASQSLFGSPADMARAIRGRIARELSLPASAGIAPVKFVAKIASDVAKPNGQREVPAEEVPAFLAPLPVGRLWGVGPRAEETLHGLGIRTLGELLSREPSLLEETLGEGGRHLHALAAGIDPREVIPDRAAKSIGAEDTFEEDQQSPDVLRTHVHSQALRVARRLREASVLARVVQVKLKFHDFSLLTRRTTLPAPTDDGQVLYRAAIPLLESAQGGRAVRLTGVSVQVDRPGEGQLPLFSEAPAPRSRLNAALDQIQAKFGSAAITTADLSGEPTEEASDTLRRRMGGSRLDDAKKR